MKAFIIDDDCGAPYVESLEILLISSNYEVEVIDSIKEARSRINSIIEADVIFLDLIMPESDPDFPSPEDKSQVGVSFFKDYLLPNFRGKIVIMTNATRDQHGVQLERLNRLAKNSPSAKVSVFHKYSKTPLTLFDETIGRREEL